MPPLLLPLPTTIVLTFSNIFLDPSSSHTSILADATAARTRLHLALQAAQTSQSGVGSLAVIDAVQTYVPYLRGLAECLDSDDLLFKTDPAFPWKASLSNYALGPPTLSMPSIDCEYLMVLLAYTLALSNHAFFTLKSLPTFEPKNSATRKAHISSEDEQKVASGLAKAVDLLQQASGVSSWIADNLCPALDGVKKAMRRLDKSKWPLETAEDTFRGFAMMFLADAHITAIRKLLLPTLSHVLFAPLGPPLPSGHPSPSLVSKIYLHIASLYSSASALLKIESGSKPKHRLFTSNKHTEAADDNVEGEAIAPVSRYLRKEFVLSSALARKWIGIDAGENGKNDKIGEAMAWMQDARDRLSVLEDGRFREKIKGFSLGRDSDRRKDERVTRKGRLEREADDINAWAAAYKSMNDTVCFQSVPPVDSLTLPTGRPVFAARPFEPPASKLHNERQSSPSETVPVVYAGRGQYF